MFFTTLLELPEQSKDNSYIAWFLDDLILCLKTTCITLHWLGLFLQNLHNRRVLLQLLRLEVFCTPLFIFFRFT